MEAWWFRLSTSVCDRGQHSGNSTKYPEAHGDALWRTAADAERRSRRRRRRVPGAQNGKSKNLYVSLHRDGGQITEDKEQPMASELRSGQP